MPDIIKISDLSIPEAALYAETSEVQLLRYYEPEPGLFLAESPKVIERAMDAGYYPVSLMAESEFMRVKQQECRDLLDRCGDIPLYMSDADTLKRLLGFPLTLGMIAMMRRSPLPSVEEICAGTQRLAVLEDVTNPTNVGAIFRSAAALGIDAILLTSGCSDPLYRRCLRVSMGTVFQIPWTFFPRHRNLSDYGLALLHQQGFASAAMALLEPSLNIDDPILSSEEKLAIILGNEGNGLRGSTIKACDYTVRIPMSHGVDSLNVAVAASIAFWQLSRR